MRQCPFSGCEAKIGPDIFSCRKHWYSLNADQRARIWSAYRRYQANQIGVEELRMLQQAVLDETTIGGIA